MTRSTRRRRRRPHARGRRSPLALVTMVGWVERREESLQLDGAPKPVGVGAARERE